MKVLPVLPQILVVIIIMQLSSASILSTLVNETLQSVDSVKDELTETAVLITHSATKAVSTVASSLCPTLSDTLGVIETELPLPPISQLTLKHIVSDSVTTYNLSSLEPELVASGLFSNADRLTIYSHGFIQSPYVETSRLMNDAYQSKENNTVFLLLDASKFIHFLYLRSTIVLPWLARALADAVAPLINKNIICAEKVHFVGHSLGAQLVGIAGQNLTSLIGQKIGRVTGLDPAGPCYIDRNDTKISKDCATFVDIIHTNGGVIGDAECLGHVDFFVNGGSVQSGCLTDICNHNRAPIYYAASVNDPYGFLAVPCSSAEEFTEGACCNATSYMGLAANSSLEGLFYLNTGATDPWALGEEGLNCS